MDQSKNKSKYGRESGVGTIFLIVLMASLGLVFSWVTTNNREAIAEIDAFKRSADTRDLRIFIRSRFSCENTKLRITSCPTASTISLYGNDGEVFVQSTGEGTSVGKHRVVAKCSPGGAISIFSRYQGRPAVKIFDDTVNLGCSI